MMLLREEVSYDVLGNGIKGIRLGSWAFLMVKKQGQWTLSLWDTENRQALTSSVHLKRVDQLPTSRAAKTLRDMLKKEGPNVVEWVLMEIKSQPGTFVTGEVEEEQEKIVIMVPTVITEEFIAEEVWQPPKPPKFIVRHFDKDNFEEKQEISLGEEDLKGRPIIYRPVYNDHLRKGMVIVPRKPVECTIEEVIQEAMVFLFVGFDACGRENEAKLLGLSALSSWILDKERSVLPIAGIGLFAPILAIRGPSGSGKNRFANMLRFLSYHPFFDVSTYRIPSLYRPLDIWKGTLVIDEGDLKSTGATSSLIHFLNSRATGTPKGRQNPDKPSKCDAFDSFGITIIAQRRHFDDNATEGRTLPFMADISDNKDIPTLETKEMIEKGMELQDKLLFLRLKYWKKIEIEKT